MQSDFATGFVNAMLGWMRSLAAAVANMFRTSSGAPSIGGEMLGWFKDHWIGLLITLIVLGVIIDWVVWLMRWRPYWLWFGKRRLVLNDEPDDFEAYEPTDRFHSHALRYDDDDYDDYADSEDGREAVDSDDVYDDEYDDGNDDAEYVFDDEDDYDGLDGESDAGGETIAFDDDFEEEYQADGDENHNQLDDIPYDDDDDGQDDGWDDVKSVRKKQPHKINIFKKHDKAEDDPFYINDDEYRKLDDDFYAVVSEDPRKGSAAAASRKERRRRKEAAENDAQ